MLVTVASRQLDPLGDGSMKPATHVKVTISARDGEVVREEVVSVYQTVAQFKACLHEWFSIPVQNMRLWYCDQVGYKFIQRSKSTVPMG